MGDVVLLRPYVASKTLRAMAREWRHRAVLALLDKKYRAYSRYLKQARELEEQGAKSEHWENECELTRRAAARLLDRALEAAEAERERGA